jgi:transposase
MKLLYRRGAGVDVHKDTVGACVRILHHGKMTCEMRAFETTVSALMARLAWLAECQCTHVAMETTGVYWKPVWHVLEGNFELVLVNASHVKNVSGRKQP